MRRLLFRRRGPADSPTSPTPDASTAPAETSSGVTDAPTRPRSVLVSQTERLPAGAGLGIDFDQAATVRRPSPRQVAFVGADTQDDTASIASRHDARPSCLPRTVSTPGPGSTTSSARQIRRPSEPFASVGPPTGTLRIQTPTASSQPFPSSSSSRPQSRAGFRDDAGSPFSLHSPTGSVSPSGSRSISRLASAQGGYPGGLRTESRNDSNNAIVLPMTWASMCEDDLVSNLGGRERTRQEVLWEIVASEERYVQELISLRDHYVEPLLRPHRSSPGVDSTSPTIGFSLGHHPASPSADDSPNMSTDVSFDQLPIAARFTRIERTLSNESVTSEQRHQQNTSTGHPDTSMADSAIAGLSHSQDPSSSSSHVAARTFGTSSSSTTRIRHHLKSTSPSPPRKLHKPRSAVPESVLAPPELPNDLSVVLEVVGEHLLPLHDALSLRLRERYTEQYPLVRNLADVFAEASWIIEHYATFITHLEVALQNVEAALATVNAQQSRGGGKSKPSEAKDARKLAKVIMRLEEKAAMDGESGLAICLSKPFQRLLKYPLLFQNLLYHTDPSTAEFASTQQMALEIDRVVRSIEDEKVDAEQRMATRDVFARIEGINDRGLMSPRSDRVLLEESPVWEPIASRRSVSDAGRLQNKKSARRLSDFVVNLGGEKAAKEPSVGSKRDVWRIRFNDVVILCQRIGFTNTPLGAEPRAKRGLPGPKRALYRFQRVETWEMQAGPALLGRRTPFVSTDDVHAEAGETDDEIGAEDSDLEANGGASRMSFTYEGDAQIASPVFLSAALANATSSPSLRSSTRQPLAPATAPSAGTRAVVGRTSSSAAHKFDRSGAAARMRGTASPTPSSGANRPPSARRFDASTSASRSRASPSSRPTSPAPAPPRTRAASTHSPPSSPPSDRRRTASVRSDSLPAPSTKLPRDSSLMWLSDQVDASASTYSSFWQAQRLQRRAGGALTPSSSFPVITPS